MKKLLTTITVLVFLAGSLSAAAPYNPKYDLSKDGKIVNLDDLLVIAQAITDNVADPACDVNDDGFVDHFDMIEVRENYTDEEEAK